MDFKLGSSGITLKNIYSGVLTCQNCVVTVFERLPKAAIGNNIKNSVGWTLPLVTLNLMFFQNCGTSFESNEDLKAQQGREALDGT